MTTTAAPSNPVVKPAARRLAPVNGTDDWRRCAHASTVVDPVLEEVTLEGTPVGVQGGWDPTAVELGPAGLCFDGRDGAYHGEPETGRVRRYAWPDVDAAEPLELFGSTAVGTPTQLPADSPPDPAGFTPERTGPLWSLLQPRALAVDADDRLLVLDAATGSVAVVDLVEGRVVHTIGFEFPPRDLAAAGRAVVALTAERAHPLLRIDALGSPDRLSSPSTPDACSTMSRRTPRLPGSQQVPTESCGC